MDADSLWTGATREDVVLPDIDLEVALGLGAQSEVSIEWDLGVAQESPCCPDKDIVIAMLRATNDKLRGRLGDTKSLLRMYARQKEELKLARSEIATLAAERDALTLSVSPVQVETPLGLEQDVVDPSLLEPPFEIALEFELQTREFANTCPGSPGWLNCASDAPLLDLFRLKAALLGLQPSASGAFGFRETDGRMYNDTSRALRMDNDLLAGADAVAEVFFAALLEAGNDELSSGILALFVSISAEAQSSNALSILLNHLSKAISTPGSSSCKALQCARLLCAGAALSAWDAHRVCEVTCDTITGRSRLESGYCAEVLGITGSTIVSGCNLITDGSTPSGGLLHCSLLAAAGRIAGSGCIERESLTSGSDAFSRAITAVDAADVATRCQKALSLCTSVEEEDANWEACTRMFALETATCDASIAYEQILNVVLWPAVPSVLPRPAQFCRLITLIGVVGAGIAAESPVLKRGLQAMESRLIGMLKVPQLPCNMRAAVMDSLTVLWTAHAWSTTDKASAVKRISSWARSSMGATDLVYISDLSRKLLIEVGAISD